MYKYKYPRPALSVDVFVHQTRDSIDELLLIVRKKAPFEGCWALPGGFVEEDETLEHAACRELEEETGLVADELRQIKAYSDPNRDPRTRVVSVAFLATVATDAIAKADSDAADARWFPLQQPLPDLAFDHDQIIKDAVELMNKNE